MPSAKKSKKKKKKHKEGRSWTSQEWKGLPDEPQPKRTTQRRTLISGLSLKISFV